MVRIANPDLPHIRTSLGIYNHKCIVNNQYVVMKKLPINRGLFYLRTKLSAMLELRVGMVRL